MTEPLLQVDNLGKRFGGFVALDGINLAVAPGERLGLIGPNGSGKSTLVNCICGTLQNETGSVPFDGQTMDGLAAHQRTHLGLARSFQLPRPFHSLSVADNLRIPLLYAVKARAAAHLTRERDRTSRCVEFAGLVGLDHKANKLPRDLTQVEMRKLELARAMAAEPKLLIADESMAGLSHSEVEDILKLLMKLNERGITIILIEHIMRAVMSFSQRLVVLVSGKKIADGKPDEVVRNPEVEEPTLANSITISGVHAAYGAVRVLEDVTLDVQPGETVVLLGTNGNGKSTLMKCIMGMVRPSAGRIVAEIDGEKHDLVGRTTEEIVDLGIALVPEGRRLFPKLTVEENLLLGAFRPTARAADRAQSRVLLRDVPAAEGAAPPARRLDERRRAADAGARPRADERAAHPAGGRAVGRPRADPGEPHHRHDQGAARSNMNLTVLMAEQNFNQAIRIADRGYVIVHGKIAFEGKSADELNNNDLIRKFYLGL